MVFPFIAVTVDTDIDILGAPNPSFGRPDASIFRTWGSFLSAWGHPGGPSEQQEGHVGTQNQTFIDFRVILGPQFDSFLGLDRLICVFVWSLFPCHILQRFLIESIEIWRFLKQGFRKEGLEKTMF